MDQEPRIHRVALPQHPVPGRNVRGLTGRSNGMYGVAVMNATRLIAAIQAEENATTNTSDTGTIFNRLVGPIWVVTMEVTLAVFKEYVHFTEEPSDGEWAFIEVKLQIANTYFFDHVFGDQNLALCGIAWHHLKDYHHRQQADFFGLMPLSYMGMNDFADAFAPYFSEDDCLAMLGPLKYCINVTELWEQTSQAYQRNAAGQDPIPAQVSCSQLVESLGQLSVNYFRILWKNFNYAGLRLAAVGEYPFTPTAELHREFTAIYQVLRNLKLIPLAHDIPIVVAWSVADRVE